MTYKEFPPHPSLQQYIKCFWIFENSYNENHLERMVPDGFIDFVFHYGIRPKLIVDGKETAKPTDFLGGHLINSVQLNFSGDLKMFGIKFYPWASASLYKMPAYELNNKRVAIEDITGNWIKQHYDYLRNELNDGNYKNAIALLEPGLQKWLQTTAPQNNILLTSFVAISKSGGNATIDDVSNRTGVSSRQIQKIFLQKKGMPYKYFAKLYRFQKTLQLAKNNPCYSLTDIAHLSNYYDQSHFIKDFKTFTGLTPGHFFKEKNIYIEQNI